MARGAGEGNYPKKATILSISVKGGDYLREAINHRKSIIPEKIQYSTSLRPPTPFHPPSIPDILWVSPLSFTRLCNTLIFLVGIIMMNSYGIQIFPATLIIYYLQSVSFKTVFNALLTALVPTVKLSKSKRGHP